MDCLANSALLWTYLWTQDNPVFFPFVFLFLVQDGRKMNEVDTKTTITMIITAITIEEIYERQSINCNFVTVTEVGKLWKDIDHWMVCLYIVLVAVTGVCYMAISSVILQICFNCFCMPIKILCVPLFTLGNCNGAGRSQRNAGRGEQNYNSFWQGVRLTCLCLQQELQLKSAFFFKLTKVRIRNSRIEPFSRARDVITDPPPIFCQC